MKLCLTALLQRLQVQSSRNNAADMLVSQYALQIEKSMFSDKKGRLRLNFWGGLIFYFHSRYGSVFGNYYGRPTTKISLPKQAALAIHGHTAAELIVQRADATQAHMGLTSWEKAPDGKLLKTDVSVAKNYLRRDELASLGRIVNAYLDLAEERAQRKIPMTMEDWAQRLDSCPVHLR